MRERIRGPEPAVWREHGEPVGLEGCGDRAVAVDQRGVGEAGGERVRVLVHPEHRHPVRRVFADLDPLEHFPDRVGERTAPRKHQEPATGSERGQGFDH